MLDEGMIRITQHAHQLLRAPILQVKLGSSQQRS
jgi:hypothetical protein